MLHPGIPRSTLGPHAHIHAGMLIRTLFFLSSQLSTRPNTMIQYESQCPPWIVHLQYCYQCVCLTILIGRPTSNPKCHVTFSKT
jgi:hypothetical protein